MKIACLRKADIARFVGFSSSLALWLKFSGAAFAQSAATSSAGKGGTSAALPNAGSTELTYIIFIGGVILFVLGMMKLILSFRE